MEKSKVAHEQGNILVLIMALIGGGVYILITCAETPDFEWKRVALGLILIGVGCLMAYLREYLKLNRWSEFEDNSKPTILQRLIQRLEKTESE